MLSNVSERMSDHSERGRTWPMSISKTSATTPPDVDVQNMGLRIERNRGGVFTDAAHGVLSHGAMVL